MSRPCIVTSEYWTHKPLTYTQHALTQADERKLPVLHEMPPGMCLADIDYQDREILAFIAKVTYGKHQFFLIVRPQEYKHDVYGLIITTFAADGYKDWQHRKSQWRQHVQRNSFPAEAYTKLFPCHPLHLVAPTLSEEQNKKLRRLKDDTEHRAKDNRTRKNIYGHPH